MSDLWLQNQRVQVPNIWGFEFQKTIQLMVFVTKTLKCWVLGGSGKTTPGSWARSQARTLKSYLSGPARSWKRRGFEISIEAFHPTWLPRIDLWTNNRLHSPVDM